MKAAVFIEKKARTTFKRLLDAAGFVYTEHPGITKGTLLLKVEAESVEALRPTLERAMKESRN